MATDDDTTKPFDSLSILCGRYEALERLSAEFLGHDSPVLALLDGINAEFRASLDALASRGLLS